MGWTRLRLRLSAMKLSPNACPTCGAVVPPVPVPTPLLVSREHLAVLLGVTGRTVASWDQRGLLPRIRIGRTVRYHPGDVLDHLRRGARPLR